MRSVNPLVKVLRIPPAVQPPPIQPVQRKPILATRAGRLFGQGIRVSDGQSVHSFLRVPFASPPTGHLRFENPIPPPFISTRDASRMPEACHKTEDCLYLNLFIPADRSSDPNGYPLLVFIPGGGFDKCTCTHHSTDYMAEHYVRRGIAYATLQYRVGVFGFGTDDSPHFPGNYALRDIHQALLFLHEHAHEIGFDASKITLAGHSAGASMLSALTVSPYSRDLFAQAIQFSGSSLSLIATGNLISNETKKVVDRLGGAFDKNPKDFLRALPASDILRAYNKIGPPMNGASVLRCSPRVDGDFIPDDYLKLIRDAKPKPTLNTNSGNEGAVFALYNYLPSIAEVAPTKIASFNADDLRQKIRDLFIAQEVWGANVERGVDEIFNFYTRGRKEHNNVDYLDAYTRAIHDCYFGVPAKMEMLEKIRCGWPVYNGIFDRLHRAVHPPKIPLRVPTHVIHPFTKFDIQARRKHQFGRCGRSCY